MSLISLASLLLAQDPSPVVTPRGVVNAYSQQPAPSLAAPGSLIWIQGLNLGPASELKATSVPFPKQLGGLEVLVNNRAAALHSVSAGRIVAQVPYETPPGLATVIVRRGEQRSRPARINVVATLVSVRTAGDQGFGPAVTDGSQITVTGLGPTEPALVDGEATADAAPRAAVRAWVGGWPAKATATHTADQPGVFQLQLDLPAKALPGDALVLVQNGRRSNAALLGASASAEVQFMPLPEGTPELRTILSADLRASFIAATGARAADGCYTGIVLDLALQSTSKLPDCLAAPGANAVTPFQQATDGTALAAFVGPAKSQTEVSDRVLLLNAAKAEAQTITLPEAGRLLASAPEGNLAALMGNQGVLIDAESGEVRPLENAAGLVGGIAPGAGGAVGVGVPAVDLGGGLNRLLSQPVGVGAGTRLTVVGDSIDDPTKAKVVGLNAQNAVTVTRDFPEGWLPLAAPAPQLQAGPGGQQLPAAVTRLSVTSTFDAPQRTYYVAARRIDNSRHGFVAFRTDRDEVRAIEFPEGWFATVCTANVRFFGVELVRRIGLLASNSPERVFSNACSASGFLLFDLDEQRATAVALPGAGQFSATQGTDEMNDYIFGSNIDPSRQGTADTLYVLDGVTATAFRVDLPPGLTGFSQLRPVQAMNLLVGLGRAQQQAGDAGLVVFDLDRGQGTVFPTPEGFTAVQLVDIFPASRKVVARGTRQGATATQLLVYDLAKGDLQIVANPAGVAFVGAPVAVPGAGGGQGPGGGQAPGGGQVPGQGQNAGVNLRANVRAHAVLALTYDAERRQNGVMVLRLP